MSVLLQVAQLGHPVLRKKARLIKNIESGSLQLLIDNLIATVSDVSGVGIAAPQVYESKKLFIVASHPNARYPNAPEMKPTAIINPKIISYSEEKIKDWEGCLSIPGVRALVPRSKSIEIEYFTRKNKKEIKQFHDFIARIFQHEYDHLNGLVFLDRVQDTKEIIVEKEYQKIMMREKN